MREQAVFWRDPELGDLEVMHATYMTHAFTPHRHSSFVTSVIDRGVGTIWYRGAKHIAPAGSLVVLNPDEVHTGEVYGVEGWTYRALYPGVELLADVVGAMTEHSSQVYFSPVPILSDAMLATLLLRLHAALAESSSVLERESWLLQTYSYLYTRYAERPVVLRRVGREPWAVQVTRKYLDTHFEHNVSLAQLAQITGLSPFYLVRVFHQEIGLPPHAYLNQVRLEHAKQLLLAGSSVATAAYKTGFADQSHLTKRFKQIYGVTPGHVFRERKNVQY